MRDAALELLTPYLQAISVPTVWFADENVLPLLQTLETGLENLHIVCNRYDIYQLAVRQSLSAEYNDFIPAPRQSTPARILYRVSKEKSLVHCLLSLSAQYLSNEGELVLTGHKQDGIKGYHDKLLKVFNCKGHYKKRGLAYLGKYTHFCPQSDGVLACHDYRCLQRIDTDDCKFPFFYSKPGVFGWQKIDRGSELLLSCLSRFLDGRDTRTYSVLDLGCGYGWLFMNLSRYNFSRVVATDNNAAALFCAQKNSDAYGLNIDIVASDAGDNLTDHFDLIVCNPPFHQGFKHSQSLTHKFIGAIAKQLSEKGNAFLVVNQFLPLEKIAQGYFLQAITLFEQSGFKVLRLFTA